jgi:hypothetical protein
MSNYANKNGSITWLYQDQVVRIEWTKVNAGGRMPESLISGGMIMNGRVSGSRWIPPQSIFGRITPRQANGRIGRRPMKLQVIEKRVNGSTCITTAVKRMSSWSLPYFGHAVANTAVVCDLRCLCDGDRTQPIRLRYAVTLAAR